ncbi:MAG: galactose-1-phosphate uridylyltransferase [Desulfuromonas sp.]|nr:MAG: galactose-1-phosphate uridylyltransferase [Desulfuromonas sp.]
MSELRYDPLKQTWVVIADHPGSRPGEFLLDRIQQTMTLCPFCVGQEHRTPPELFAIRDAGSHANGPGWQVRVMPNKYPTFGIEGDQAHRGVGLYDVKQGIGAHEVVVETPDHDRHPADLTPQDWVNVLRAWRSRLLDLRRDTRFRDIFVFKNHGLEAGAVIPHSHSQIMAVPTMPPLLATELNSNLDHFLAKERCLHCDLLLQERETGDGVVRDDGQYLVYSPFASRYPFELRIVPIRHQHDFAIIGDERLLPLGEAIHETLQRIRSALRDPPMNLLLVTAPPEHPRVGRPEFWNSLHFDFHWYLEIVPCLKRMAGFERSTGFHLNSTLPSEAARFLREAELQIDS